MKAKTIIEYLEHPKVKYKSTIGDICDFETDTLKKMVDELNDTEKEKLLTKAITVCEQWRALRVAPNNCIGTVARYQECRMILKPTHPHQRGEEVKI